MASICKDILQMVEVGSTDTNLIASFKSQFGELTKLYVEAKDNVKFLTTLERHFKNISHGSLTQILDTLSPMMGALRMVWIISRHYSDDTRMGTLFERIANEIGNRVAAEINVKVLFTWSPADATARISLAKSVLEHWSEVYLQVRELIELSARDQRWEFDRKRLFDRTNYMASICKDILQMVEVVDDFHKFLGPELKAVTGDSQGIDSVIMRVQQMVDPIENLQFDAFEKKFQTQWQGVNAKFTTDKEQIERATRAFIDSSFKKLRSAEGAFELLQNFKSIKSEGAINRQMMDKFNDILEQFSREIDTTRDIFEANKARPPVTRNQPPVAGAINWSRSLFQRIRKTYNRLAYSEDEEMMQEEAGHDVQRKYLSLAKAMMQFEKSWFSSWAENVDGLAMTHLKQAIVCKDPGGVIVVNFHDDLTRLIRETRYSDRMGFTIPETALNVTLQEEKYHGYVEGLRTMLENYHNAIAALTPVEKSLLAKRLVKLEKVLNPGFSPLNWNSLGIPDFVAMANKAIGEFNSLVNQVQKNSSIIDLVVQTIATAATVVDPCVPRGDVVEIQDLHEFYEVIERNRMETAEELLRKYRTIAPLLGKIEEAVAGTNTGRSPQLKEYYYFWEKGIFNALNTLVLNGMSTFLTMILKRNVRKMDPALLKMPLFKVQAVLVHPEVVLQPPVAEVTKFLSRLVRNMVESTRSFVRWMDGTCIETPEQFVHVDDDEPVVFSFYSDVSANPEVIKTMLTINHSIQRTISGCNRFTEGWKKHQHLWKQDKHNVLDKFAATGPSCQQFEEKLARYQKMSDDIFQMPRNRDMDFVRVSSHSLVLAVRDEALQWVQTIGKVMADLDRVKLNEMRAMIDEANVGLHADPSTLEDLKGVLNVIATIRKQFMMVELEYLDLEERFRTRDLYAVLNDEEEAKEARNICHAYKELLEEVDRVDASLEDVKLKFTDITITQVLDFSASNKELLQELKTSGPGLPAIDLDLGVELLKKFQEIMLEKTAMREELVLAEKLFDLPLTSHPELFEVERELKNLALIYIVYSDHVSSSTSSATCCGLSWT